VIERIITTPHPTVGVVVGTYGSVPYVHLHLEVWRRNYGNIPLLVHDDCSPDGEALQALCARYGAGFSCNEERFGHGPGDMTVFLSGLRWAHDNNLDILVKFSRRFVPRINWIMDLQLLAYVSQYATYSSYCTSNNFGFRTECVAMHVPSWVDNGAVDALQRQTEEVKGQYCFLEPVMHGFAKGIHTRNCLFNKLYETVHPPPGGADSYGDWRFMGTDRRKRHTHFLWHEANVPFEYYLESISNGILDYDASIFEDPRPMTGMDSARILARTPTRSAKRRHKQEGTGQIAQADPA